MVHVALSDAFINNQVSSGSAPFRVAWYTSDTTYTIKYMSQGVVDIGITYSEVAERLAIEQGIAKSPSYFAFRDHFLLVGPPSNPAGLKKDDNQDVLALFSTLHQAAERPASSTNNTVPVRFLSRYDKSATNIKESLLWLGIGQVPWATAYSTWYHQYIAFPIQALTAAILLNEYTITDRGTILSLPPHLAQQTVIYKAATDSLDDPLLNPAHVLVSTKAADAEVTQKFADWVVSKEGQKVITDFKKNGEQLYTGAPTEEEKKQMGLRKRWIL